MSFFQSRRAFPLLFLGVLAALRVSSGQPASAEKDKLALLSQSELVEKRFERRELIYQDAALTEHLAAVARPLLPNPAPDHVRWRFLVLREPVVTAVALPDGSIYMSTGLLTLLEDDDQLAAVMAHEIAHTVNGDAFAAQHEYHRREAVRNGAAIAAVLAAPALGSASVAYEAADLAAFRVLANAGEPIAWLATTGYRDELEHAADQAALATLARAGKNPAALVRSLQLMADSRDPEPFLTIYTDPEKLRARAVAIAKSGGKQAPSAPDSAFSKAVQGAIRENVPLDIASRRYRAAVAAAQRLATADPEDAEAICLLGDAYRALGPRDLRVSAREQSPDGRRAAAKAATKHTAEEEDKLLEATPQGRDAERANWQYAAELFAQAIRLDSRLPQAHRGLAALYQQQGRLADARAEYSQYLELAPNAPDRLRIEGQLTAIEAALSKK